MKMPKLPSVRCPDCGGQACTRTSKDVTDLYRELRYECSNEECGHVFLASLCIVHSIIPSALRKATSLLPISPAFRPANDRISLASNDSGYMKQA